MVIRNDNVILDAYFYPYDGSIYHDLASVPISVVITLIGIAADQGKLDLDDPMLSFFPDRQIANRDERKERITSRWIDEWIPVEEPEKALAQTIRCYAPTDFLLLLEGTRLRVKHIEVKGQALQIGIDTITLSNALMDVKNWLITLSLLTVVCGTLPAQAAETVQADQRASVAALELSPSGQQIEKGYNLHH